MHELTGNSATAWQCKINKPNLQVKRFLYLIFKASVMWKDGFKRPIWNVVDWRRIETNTICFHNWVKPVFIYQRIILCKTYKGKANSLYKHILLIKLLKLLLARWATGYLDCLGIFKHDALSTFKPIPPQYVDMCLGLNWRGPLDSLLTLNKLMSRCPTDRFKLKVFSHYKTWLMQHDRGICTVCERFKSL